MGPGAVTFLFTDVEGSTRMWEEHPDEMPAVLGRHDEIVRAAIEDRGGTVFATTGEGCAAAFPHASDAVASAIVMQRDLASEPWPEELTISLRTGLYTGDASERDGVYAGPVPNRAARIMAAGHGGQILIGAPTAAMLEDVELADLGEHRFQDLAGVEQLFQVGADGLRAAFPPLRTVSARAGNTPAPASALVGRAWELAEVVGLVREHRLVTLTGVGGVGKTRLALEAGARLEDEFADGVWFVELAPVGEAASVADAVATALGITPQADVPVTSTVAETLSGRQLLLVLDNCEHVLDAAAEVSATILARSETVRVLATSREGLGATGERLMPVPPLALDGGAASAAVALFVERARAVDPTFALEGDATADAVTQICRGLDGLALGIELAAAWTSSVSPVDLQRWLLADRFRLLSGSERQRSLKETVGWSYELLDDDQRNVLLHASVFSGGFALDAIVDLLGEPDALDVLGHLDSLVRKSLVTTTKAGGTLRYGLLETIRQFAEEELAANGDVEAVRDRHAVYFAREVQGKWDVWHGPGFHGAVDWVTAEFANLRAAYRWAADRGDAETAVDIAAHVAMIGTSAELFEAVGWVEDVIEAATAADVRRLPRLLTAGGYSCFTGRPEQGVAHAQAAQRLEPDARYDPFEPGWATFIEALAQVYCGRLDQYVERAQQVAALPGPARAYGLPGFADGLQATGRVDEALEIVEEAVAAARDQANPWLIAYATWVSGSVYAHGDPAHALAVWREGLEYVRQHRLLFFEGFIARDAALLQLADAVPSESLDLFDTAIDSFRRSGNVAQLRITVASTTTLFDRIDVPEVAATLSGAITGAAGGDHHVPELPDLVARVTNKLGRDRFAECSGAGSTMELGAAARYAQEQIEIARSRLSKRTGTHNPAGDLTRREVEVLRLVAEGLTTREVADRLFISPKTADHHIQHIYTKTGVSNRAAVTLWAFQQGIVA